MRIRHCMLSALCFVCILCLGGQAQNTTPPKKMPQLTMDDLDNRPGSSPPENAAANISSNNTMPAVNSGAKTMLESAWRKMANLKSGRMKFSNKSPNGVNEMFYEFTSADRVRILKDGVETIVIGPLVYMHAQGQEWKKTTKEQVFKTADISFQAFTKFSAEKTSQIQLVGEEALDQVPMLKFKVMDDRNMTYMWVGKGDGFVYKVEMSSALSGPTATMIFSDFNADVSITSPEQ